jgi:hypothetical protein
MTRHNVVPTLDAPALKHQTLGRFHGASSESRVSRDPTSATPSKHLTRRDSGLKLVLPSTLTGPPTMDDGSTTGEAGRWLSYAELADVRGITRKAAARLTLRHRCRVRRHG